MQLAAEVRTPLLQFVSTVWRDKHTSRIYTADGSKNKLRILRTNWRDNTPKLPQRFSTQDHEAVHSFENVSKHLADWTVL